MTKFFINKINGDIMTAYIEWYNKGNAHYRLRKYSEAIECYDRALELNPNLAVAWYNKGITLKELGKHSEAIECFNMADRLSK
jgi:tetratricopeptide (TPR) repeat protein